MKKNLVLIITVSIVLFSASVYATNSRVAWTPASLNPWSIEPGAGATYTATVTNLGPASIPNDLLALNVTGDIKPFVTATARFPKVFKKGNSAQVTIHVTSSSSTPVRVVNGRISLARVLPNGKLKEVFSNSLPLELTFSHVALPPDPGEAGKETLLGIDADTNGVRDDIDRYIGLTYPESQIKRTALSDKARIAQMFLRDWRNKQMSRANSLGGEKPLGCVWYVFRDKSLDDPNEPGYHAYDLLRSEILNTRERITAYRKADSQLSGMVSHGPNGLASECSFNPATLPN